MIRHSRIFRGETTHERLSPTAHRFRYPLTFFAFDPAELDAISASVPFFSHNRPNWLSLRDADFFAGGDDGSLSDRIAHYLGPLQRGERDWVVTSPRYLGYAFNPVNFHLRLREDRLLGAIAEVNNTFGDRHVYPLTALSTAREPGTWTAASPKAFHVSPFNSMEGEYRFTFRILPDHLFLGVDLHREGGCVMRTWMQGRPRMLRAGSILRYLLLHPADTAVNSMPRIVWQAARLRYQRRLQVFARPSPESEHTLIDRDTRESDRPVV